MRPALDKDDDGDDDDEDEGDKRVGKTNKAEEPLQLPCDLSRADPAEIKLGCALDDVWLGTARISDFYQARDHPLQGWIFDAGF